MNTKYDQHSLTLDALVYVVDVFFYLFLPPSMSKVLAAVGNWVCSSAASAPSFAAVSPKRDTGA